MTVQGGNPNGAQKSPDPLALAKRVAWKFWPYAAALVAVLVMLGILFRRSVSWGDVATWVLAVTTLLAFLAAAFAGIVAYDLLKVENARDEAAAQERLLAAADRQRVQEERMAWKENERRAQANRITAWFGKFEEHRIDKDIAESVDIWGAYIQNSSDLPILDVRIFFYWVNDPRDGSEWTTELRYASVEKFRVIPPGKTRNLELPQRVRTMAQKCNDDVYLVAVEFTDASGAHWKRNEYGSLQDQDKW
jgi:hypothetical protein